MSRYSYFITLNPRDFALTGGANGQGFRPPPPNPSRLANGQGFRPPPTLHDLQMDKGLGPPPQPFTTCKWTRVWAPLPNPSRLANGQGFGPPPPQPLHDLQMDKGLGPPPTLHDLQMDKGLGPPNPSRLANGQGFRPPQPFTTCKWTRV